MPADNVDIFKKVIFNIPSCKKVAAGILFFGFLFGTLFYFSLKIFAGNLFNTSALSLVLIPGYSLALLMIPTLVSGELLKIFLPEYPRRWGYFLALCNQLIFSLYLLILSGANTLGNAWSVLWIGLTTVFLSNLLVLLMTMGYSYFKKITLLSGVQPLIMLLSVHVFLGRALRIPIQGYLSKLYIFIMAAFILVVVLSLAEYLLKANVADVSVLKLTSALLQKRQQELDLGYPTEIDVQTLQIENRDKKATIAVPWAHPGPLEGFGGGKMTSRIISELNEEGTGFLFHVPSNHKSDPADPEDCESMLKALCEPAKVSEASGLHRKEYSDSIFYGRKIDGKKIVYFHTERFDDYEMPIMQEAIDTDEVILVDLHCDDEDEDRADRREMWYNTAESKRLRKNLLDFIEELERLETREYKAGFSTDLEGVHKFAMVEEVDGQRVLTMGIDGNGVPESLRELGKSLEKDYDEVITFTTDAHKSIHELSSKDILETDRMVRAIEKAESNVSSADIGFESRKTGEIRLLQEDYYSLLFSINILVRLMAISLLFVYAGLVLWIF
ncbi:MAG: DUF2070 family protein [Candidatus Nanohaloarchaea archaeon]